MTKHPQVEAELRITKPSTKHDLSTIDLPEAYKLERVEAVCFEEGFLACVALLEEQRKRALETHGPSDAVFRVLDAICDEKLALLANALATMNYPEHDPLPPAVKVNDVGF